MRNAPSKQFYWFGVHVSAQVNISKAIKHERMLSLHNWHTFLNIHTHTHMSTKRNRKGLQVLGRSVVRRNVWVDKENLSHILKVFMLKCLWWQSCHVHTHICCTCVHLRQVGRSSALCAAACCRLPISRVIKIFSTYINWRLRANGNKGTKFYCCCARMQETSINKRKWVITGNACKKEGPVARLRLEQTKIIAWQCKLSCLCKSSNQMVAYFAALLLKT